MRRRECVNKRETERMCVRERQKECVLVRETERICKRKIRENMF